LSIVVDCYYSNKKIFKLINTNSLTNQYEYRELHHHRLEPMTRKEENFQILFFVPFNETDIILWTGISSRCHCYERRKNTKSKINDYLVFLNFFNKEQDIEYEIFYLSPLISNKGLLSNRPISSSKLIGNLTSINPTSSSSE